MLLNIVLIINVCSSKQLTENITHELARKTSCTRPKRIRQAAKSNENSMLFPEAFTDGLERNETSISRNSVQWLTKQDRFVVCGFKWPPKIEIRPAHAELLSQTLNSAVSFISDPKYTRTDLIYYLSLTSLLHLQLSLKLT